MPLFGLAKEISECLIGAEILVSEIGLFSPLAFITAQVAHPKSNFMTALGNTSCRK